MRRAESHARRCTVACAEVGEEMSTDLRGRPVAEGSGDLSAASDATSATPIDAPNVGEREAEA
jgi:hypothetical protein